MTEMEKNMKEEIGALRKAARDREQDLEALSSVLLGNQDLINVRASTPLNSSWIPTELKWDLLSGSASGSRGE